MKYKLDKNQLFDILREWNRFLKRKVHLVACGGTAMTLNDYDLISSKLMRGTKVDFEDCLSLTEFRKEKIDVERLIRHFLELVSYDVAEYRLRPNIDHFLGLLREKRLYD